jgi:hypothetical protein
MVGAICLESKGPMSCPSQGRVAENAEPFDNKAEASLNATTNLVGPPEEGEEVSAPVPLVSLSFAVMLHTHNSFAIARLQGRLHRPHPRGEGGEHDLPLRSRQGGAQKSLARACLSMGDRFMRTETR